MADLASAVVDSVVKYMTDAAVEQIGLVSAFQTHLDTLKNTFLKIQPLLHDAEIQQWKDKALQVWLRELKDAVHDVENVLDEVATEDLRQQALLETGKSCLCFNNSLSFRVKMANKVKTLGDKLTKIADQRDKFNLREHHGLASRETCSSVIESEIVGRTDDKRKIRGKLLDNHLDQSDLSVYAICGMGGRGKTTLAQLVYNDKEVEKHFDLRIWVCVSEDFDVKRLVKEMIESIDGCECKISGLDPLQRDLREKLMRKKFLLVLDDVWNDEREKWDELRKILSCGSKGSAVMVTTRIETVASMMANVGTHPIGILSDEDSWKLFKQRAFPTDQEVDENLASMGKTIVNKCGGVALAIKALGGIMRSKSEENEWLEVVNSEIWNVLENDISPALRLSYYNLPPYMRQCFAYCCIFPKDTKMKKDELIQLWMANGFVPSNGQEDLFVRGCSIFKELTWRSFFQDIETDDRGTTTCKMHDLMHDLAASAMGQDVYILNHGNAFEIPKALHLVCSGDQKIKFSKSTGNSVRTLIGKSFNYVSKDLRSFLLKQQYARVLSLRYFSADLCDLAYKFKHLRFLVMPCHLCKKLPESITQLYNLQTLKLLRSSAVRKLPKKLKLMKNLLFLQMESNESLQCTPPELGKLSLLRRLSIFIVGEDALQQINQLKELNLGGELTIRGLNNVASFEDAKNANLMMKMDLTYLGLEWTGDLRNKSPSHFDMVLQGLQPHHNLERILIKSFPGSKFSDWISNLSYINLKEIQLRENKNCEQLPPMGNLPSLTTLRLIGLDSIKCLGADWLGNKECSFPALKSMEIKYMSKLEEWYTPELIQSYPCLTDLQIDGCPMFGSMPSFPSIKKLGIRVSNVALFESMNNLTSLDSLELTFDGEDNAVPDNSLQSNKALTYLKIQGRGIKSTSIMLNNHSALETLKFIDCPNLESLPKDLSGLTSLEELVFFDCHKLGEFPATVLEGLPSLKSLCFEDCDELVALSGPLEKTSPPLQQLTFGGLPKLQSLPECMQQLTALTHLAIFNCPGLDALPQSITSLESLMCLLIEDCSKELEKRCEKEKGEDWPNISHIPTIRIYH